MKQKKRVHEKSSHKEVKPQVQTAPLKASPAVDCVSPFVWETVPAFNGPMDRKRWCELRGAVILAAREIEAAFDKQFEEGMARLRSLYLLINHHPDLGAVTAALSQVTNNASMLKIADAKSHNDPETNSIQTFSQDSLAYAKTLNFRVALTHLCGLEFLLLNHPPVADIGQALEIIDHGYTTLMRFTEEVDNQWGLQTSAA